MSLDSRLAISLEKLGGLISQDLVGLSDGAVLRTGEAVDAFFARYRMAMGYVRRTDEDAAAPFCLCHGSDSRQQTFVVSWAWMS
jgi:hypothetical protein